MTNNPDPQSPDPTSEAEPDGATEIDLEAAWPEYSYLIVSVTSAGVAERRQQQRKHRPAARVGQLKSL